MKDKCARGVVDSMWSLIHLLFVLTVGKINENLENQHNEILVPIFGQALDHINNNFHMLQ